jgi:hypothetical protein
MIKQSVTVILVIFVSAVLSACGGSGSSTSAVNRAPIFVSSGLFSVEENQLMIGTVVARDDDSDTITFSISGTDISIGNDDGVLTFTSAPDYEMRSTYSATVVATDGVASTEQRITVTILDVADAPPEITTFTFLTEHNPNLMDDITLSIIDQQITGRTPTVADVSQLKATFEYQGTSITVADDKQESTITANNFTQPVIYRLESSNGQVADYTVDLAVFTGLPVVYLSTNDERPIQSKDDYVVGQTSVLGGRQTDDVDLVDMKIRGRGNSTWDLHPKKPFQMKLSDKAKFLGMPKDKKWLFLAEYSDKTMLRNKIAFEMGYISNLDWTPQGRFAEVFINNEYNGTYNITQKVEEGDNRVALGDTGFLLELDQVFRLDPDDVYFESNATDKFLVNIKEPELTAGSSQFMYIKNMIHAFEDDLFGDNFKSQTQGYATHIDLDSFIDWYLISEITKNVDSQFFSSIYLHLSPGELIKMGPLWDFDLSFGNVDYADSQYTEGFWVKYHPWYSRLFEDPNFVQLVNARFSYFMENQGFILSKIDAYAEQLRWAQQENDDKWQTLGTYVWPNPVVFDTYQEEVEHLKSWYINRMAWLEEALATL